MLAHLWKAKIGFFGYAHDTDEIFLLTEPAGPPGAERVICVLWTGSHYELLILSTEAWTEAQKLEPDMAGS